MNVLKTAQAGNCSMNAHSGTSGSSTTSSASTAGRRMLLAATSSSSGGSGTSSGSSASSGSGSMAPININDIIAELEKYKTDIKYTKSSKEKDVVWLGKALNWKKLKNVVNIVFTILD